MSLKLALVQSHIVWEDKEENLRRAGERIAECAGTELILFPEMSFTGFSMHVDKTAEGDKLDADTVSRMREYAKKYATAIGFGWVKRAGDKCRNVYSIVNKDGEIISEYEKLHPFSYSGEDKYFSGGDKLVTYMVGDIPFSTFICYDLRFPEEFRMVADKAHAVIIPACWPTARAEHWKALLKARAIENQLHVIGINCVGDIGGQHYSGDSCLIDPDGCVCASLGEREGVLRYELNDDVEAYREAFPVLSDKRPYSLFIDGIDKA